ncbi:PLP-dependent aminotransferase family protein [Bacillus sp. 03113]|uniref:aminotransferase-like domain-containing protein n=1 Tax=Bacillus sp. 03113 TaxID=2578211 RepID=UPI0011427B10|nr:PLP-dependent aminotransferase family protein [Bacillus sp. 03113]
MPINSFDHFPLSWKPNKALMKQPYFTAVADQLEHDIKNGSLAPGTKLPPQRELADYLDLNFTTITRAYNLCKKKGLIYGTTGRGTFVSHHVNESITITGADLSPSCIEMGMVSGFEQYNEMVVQATKSVIEKGYLNNLYKYSYPTGHPHQLTAANRWLEQLGIHVDSDQIAIFSGAQNALTNALISLFEPGDKIATDEYTYSNFIELAKLLHIQLVPITGDQNGMCADALELQCKQNKITGLYLMPSCANPTTIKISLSRKKELAEVIRRRKLILIEDDIFACMITGRKVYETIPLFSLVPEQTLYVCSTSKSLCSGIRIAYLVFPVNFRKKILHGLYNTNIKTSSLDAEIITELILNGNAYAIVEKKRELAVKAGAIFERYFPECPSLATPYCFYRWLPIPNTKPSSQVERELEKAGIRAYHSDRFIVRNQTDKPFLRISLSDAGSMSKLDKGLSILKEYLET